MELISVVALFLILLLTLLYLIKRNGFYISVNCWFCDSWTRVLYADRNSFCCPFCLQYNGFNEDGGYNKVIEAQFDLSANNQYRNRNNIKTEPLSNGLCSYCNNNQQLKIRQLADFVPINEKNYDVEIEHFRMQLEKSYKLCKKCDKILEKTIQKQHAWIFGNQIKNFQKRSPNKSKSISTSKTSIITHFIKFSLVLCLLIIFCQAVTAKFNYSGSTVKIPDIFVPYVVMVNDWCHLCSSNAGKVIRYIDNKFHLHHLPVFRKLRIIKSDILPIAWVGLILEILLLIRLPKSILWKVNELLGWIILIITSLNIFDDRYFVYVNAVQIVCSFAIICGLFITNKDGHRKLVRRKKYTFKKLKSSTVNSECSDEEIFEETSNSSLSSGNSEKSSNYLNTSSCQLHSPNSSPQNDLSNTANFNDTFASARSTKSSSVFNSSLQNRSIHACSNELHHSLDNLHLSNISCKPQSCVSPVFSINSMTRPILSPPKLKNITQNSWTAGGFWKNDITAYPVATDFANLSRSSSQSSGFMSSNDNNVFSSLPPSREPSLYGDFEKTSILSEPAYHFKPINSSNRNSISFHGPQMAGSSPKATQLYYKAENNMFYPVLKQNSVLLIQGSDIPKINFEGSFSNLSLTGLNRAESRYRSPVFGEKPVISSLFKNIQGLSTQPCTFRAPNC